MSPKEGYGQPPKSEFYIFSRLDAESREKSRSLKVASGQDVRTMLRYKVVELSTVTDETIEEALNSLTPEGWRIESLHFAMRDSSKRPSMAFLLFTREEPEKEAAEGGSSD